MNHGKGDRCPIISRIDVSNFLKDAPRVPKLGMTSNRFPKILIGINGPWVIS